MQKYMYDKLVEERETLCQKNIFGLEIMLWGFGTFLLLIVTKHEIETSQIYCKHVHHGLIKK